MLHGHTALCAYMVRVVCRVKTGQAMASIDVSRLSLPKPPANKQNDYNAWKHAVDNAHSQIEHQQLRWVTPRVLGCT